MAKKYYVVWAGREPGVYTDWATCKRSIDKFSGARYKSFPTQAEADAAFAAGAAPATATKKSKLSANSDASEAKTRIVMGSHDVEIFCDGGCDPNPGKAGSGSAVYHKGRLAQLWYGLYDANGTNNTAELNALHQSLIIAKQAVAEDQTVAIYCDSMYSINCVTVWAYGWKKNGWKKRGGEIKNLDMIKAIHTLYNELKGSILLQHVKAHIGIEGNELADRMTMLAVDRAETDYVQYTDTIDIPALLSLRAG
jgi:ribonuclease HI